MTDPELEEADDAPDDEIPDVRNDSPDEDVPDTATEDA